MRRLLAIPLFAVGLTLASVLIAWRPDSWGIAVVRYGYPMGWLASFTSAFGTRWGMNAVGLAADCLFWLASSAAGVFSLILLQEKGLASSKITLRSR